MISFGKISNIPAAGDRQGPVLPCKGEFVRAAKILSDGMFKVSVKENEVPKEKNSSRASVFATKASYISN